jgi:hypothetical protein
LAHLPENGSALRAFRRCQGLRRHDRQGATAANAKAATAAIREAGEIAKRDGRASIAAAGFSRKWQNALRVNFYPPQGDSMRPAAFIFHKIRYAGVFEEGVVIGGQPLLWLPLPNVPLRRGQPMTPSQYARSIGPLVSVQRPASCCRRRN